jgi:acyl-CoA thioester hydrolase
MRRGDYALVHPLATRWSDNDIYGHVNNVVYYSWFDTAVNEVLISRGLLDPHGGAIIGLVVESGCRYHRPLAFPQRVELGLRVGRLGTSSIRWEIGVFGDDAPEAAADGHFVHVHVDRETRRPVPLPDMWRAGLADLVRQADGRFS